MRKRMSVGVIVEDKVNLAILKTINQNNNHQKMRKCSKMRKHYSVKISLNQWLNDYWLNIINLGEFRR